MKGQQALIQASSSPSSLVYIAILIREKGMTIYNRNYMNRLLAISYLSNYLIHKQVLECIRNRFAGISIMSELKSEEKLSGYRVLELKLLYICRHK